LKEKPAICCVAINCRKKVILQKKKNWKENIKNKYITSPVVLQWDSEPHNWKRHPNIIKPIGLVIRVPQTKTWNEN
jgi:hypothetical protein